LPISWNGSLVVLSVLIAMFGSFTALSHAERMRESTGRQARAWMLAGGVTLGMAVWSMHFIGMLAFHLPIPLAYDTELTFISALPAIAAALLGFHLLRSPELQFRKVLVGGFFMGLGITAMHYTGMAALKMQPAISYDPTTFVLSVVIAITAAIGAMLIVYAGEKTGLHPLIQHLLGAVIMGFAIAGMHYTGMAAAHFAPNSVCLVGGVKMDPNLLALMVTLGCLGLFSTGGFANSLDRHIALDKLRLAHAQLEASQKELQIAASAFDVQEGVMIADASHVILRINPSFTKQMGYGAKEVLGKTVEFLISERHDEEFYPGLLQALQEEERWLGEVWIRHQNGLINPYRLTITAVTNPDGITTHYVAAFSDIREFKEAQENILQLAFHDPLTQLPNRRLFHDRLEQEITRARRSNLKLALLFIDLDHFKEVNDTLGHDMGDILLKEAALRLGGCLRASDTVARQGGDEFTVILPDLPDIESVEHVVQALLHKMSLPFHLKDHISYITASIGIAFYPEDATDATQLMKSADQAMYDAKHHGGNRARYFTQSMQTVADARMAIANDLHTALAENQFRVYYQPIIELNSGAICKAEALIRWMHPTRGNICPTEFIPIAEDTGLIVEIGDWVFREAARQTAVMRATYEPRFQTSVNVSPVHFYTAHDYHVDWFDYLSEIGLPGQSLVLEITEGLLMDANESVNKQLLEFRDAGLELSLDDFGTGYSSLSYLKKFDVDYLKIDRSFVSNLTEGSDDLVICEAMIVMAHKLGMKVIAEGIETNEQRDILLNAGCDYGQGYLFSEPVSMDEFSRFYARTLA
jgi:diguanylate cyclase (GGDEF)-like protein/PAS domain S-box-containing protein